MQYLPGHPFRGQVLWFHNAACFGAVASVWNFNEAGDALQHLTRALLWLLGRHSPRGKDGVTLSPTQRQIDKLTAIVGGVLHAGSCTPEQAQRLTGKINLPNLGRAAPGPVYGRASSRVSSQHCALRGVLRDAPPRFKVHPLQDRQSRGGGHIRRRVLPRGRGPPHGGASADANISTCELHHRHPGGHAGQSWHGRQMSWSIGLWAGASRRCGDRGAGRVQERPVRPWGLGRLRTHFPAEPAISHRKKCRATLWIRHHLSGIFDSTRLCVVTWSTWAVPAAAYLLKAAFCPSSPTQAVCHNTPRAALTESY